MERVFGLKSASSCDCENTFREALTMRRLAAKTYFAPLYRGTQSSLGRIVCGLNTFMKDEGEKVLPIVKHSCGPGTDSRILTCDIIFAVPLHTPANEGRGLPELLAGNCLVYKAMPAGKEGVDFFEHVFSEALGVRAAADIQKGCPVLIASL